MKHEAIETNIGLMIIFIIVADLIVTTVHFFG